jgi:hypothetical protein
LSHRDQRPLKRRSRRLLSALTASHLLFMSATLLGVGALSAQPMTSDQAQLEAHKLVARAEALRAQGDERKRAEAISLYERAHRLAPSVRLLKRAAELSDERAVSCQQRLIAWERLRLSCELTHAQGVEGCEVSWGVEQKLKRAQERCEVRVDVSAVGHLRHQGPLTLVIDDEARGELPVSALTTAGEHSVALYQGGALVYEGSLSLKRGSKVRTLRAFERGGRLFLSPRPTPKTPRGLASKQHHPTAHSEPSVAQDDLKASALSAKLTKVSSEPKNTPAPLKAPPFSLEASLQCQYHPEGSSVHLDYPDCEGATLRRGDRVRLVLKSSREAYLYLFTSNERGERASLFPDVGVSNLVKAGVEYVLPGEGWYELDERGGVTERFQLIASRQPIAAFEQARGARLTPELLDQLRLSSARGVVRRGLPAQLSERLKAVDRALISTGDERVVALRFEVRHQ